MKNFELQRGVLIIKGLQHIADRINESSYPRIVFPNQRGNVRVKTELEAATALAKLTEIFKLQHGQIYSDAPCNSWRGRDAYLGTSANAELILDK